MLDSTQIIAASPAPPLPPSWRSTQSSGRWTELDSTQIIVASRQRGILNRGALGQTGSLRLKAAVAGAGPGWSPTPRGHAAGGWISSIDLLLLTASSHYIKLPGWQGRGGSPTPHQVARAPAPTTHPAPVRPCNNHHPAPLQQPSPRAPAPAFHWHPQLRHFGN